VTAVIVAADAPPAASAAVAAPRLRTARTAAPLLGCLALVSVIFGLPHLVIPRILGEARAYTPLAVSGVSALTYDETSTYAADVNYVLRHAAPAYDTDVFEERDVPLPTSLAADYALAGLAAVLGGVEAAFIACDFLLPPLALLLLHRLLLALTRSRHLALLGGLTILLVPFGPRNFLEVPFKLVGQRAAEVIQPLEYSRILHPEVSFTLLAAGLLLLWQTLWRRGRTAAVLAGVAGAVLFYTYAYYWPVWVGAAALLLVGASLLERRLIGALALTNAIAWLGSLPFWVTVASASRYPNLATVVGRHISEVGHLPPPYKLVYSAIYSLIFLAFAAIFWRFGSVTTVHDRRWRTSNLLFHAAIFVAGLAALNIEVITGFNVEAMLHYNNRLFQPFLTLAAFSLVLASLPRLLQLTGLSRLVRHGPRAVGVGIICLLVLAGLRQAVVASNTAAAHAMTDSHQQLFAWLNTHTQLDDVVLTSDKSINDLLPVQTHNRVFVPNAERTSAPDGEIAQRFLIAMKLLQHSPGEVRALLAQDVTHGEPPVGLTYSYFLFLAPDRWRLPDADIDRLLTAYGAIDLRSELARRRLDYVYAVGAERPADLPGWAFTPSLDTSGGHLWRVAAASGSSLR